METTTFVGHYKHMRSIYRAILVTLGAVSLPSLSWALDPASPTTSWAPVLYGGSPSTDPTADQQTGSTESDIVGNSLNPSLYKLYDANAPASLAFRTRQGMDKSPPGFTGAFFVGMDANRDGALDIFLGVNNQGSGNQIGIWAAGTGANTSPSTTTISNSPFFTYTETASNYSWQPVTAISDPTATTFDVDGGGSTDQFLSFVVPFADVQSALNSVGITGVTANTPMTFVAATATQANSLNQDLNNVNGGVNSGSTWAALGATTDVYSVASITPVPECSSAVLAVLGPVVLLMRRRRK